ncbi:MAG: TatD family hydrolase [Bacteroidota bacterium]|nr:TatD family hydrolase [Bacteroidota bacterium]
MFIDTHCHLFYEDYQQDIAEVIARAQSADVQMFVVPATNHETAQQAIALAEKYPSVFAAVGFHPLDLEHFNEENFKKIEALMSHPKVVAVGEIGIDYFYDRSPRDMQKEIFKRQIEIAVKKDMPIIVHTRDSVDDAIEIAVHYAKAHPAWKQNGKRGVFHCFTGDPPQAKILFENNFLISYPGPITFKKSTMPETLKQIGIENIMLETDSPYLTPVPHRGKRNEPSSIPLIAQKIAEIVGASVDEVANTTTRNARLLFQLP